MAEIDVGGETLHYERQGSGDPLLLIHSLGTGAWLWTEQIRRWSAFFDVIAFDVRGHGRSTNRGGVTMKNIAADLHAALREFDLLPVHVVGISMGGLILSRLHEIDPAALRSAVIADSFATQGRAGPARAEALAARLMPLSMAEYGRIYADEVLLPTTSRTQYHALAESVGATDKAAYLQTARSIYTEDVVTCMKAMRLPVRVVVGDLDDRTPPNLAEDIAAIVPGAELYRIPHAAHLANLDNPDGFHAAVDPFLRRPA